MKRWNQETLCVKTPNEINHSPSHILPLHLTSSYDFIDADKSIQAFDDPYEEMIYTRYGNVTVRSVAHKLANLESSPGNPQCFSILCNTGMSAISTLCYNLLEAGDTVWTQADLYGGTTELLTKIMKKSKVHCAIVDLEDPDQLRIRLRNNEKNPKLIYIESPSNPLLRCLDIRAICALATEYDIPVAVDNTFCTALLQRPLDLGANYVIYSTTKYLNGHGNALGGAIITNSPDLNNSLWNTAKLLGTTGAPMDAWLLENGLKTLAIRMKKHCQNAIKIAEYLQDHPAIRIVNYPGLPGHSTHSIAKKQMVDYGGMLSFEHAGGYISGIQFMNALRLITITPTLGDVDTLVLHPASSSHKNVPAELRAQSGIPDGLIRMSVGIEHLEDLKEDIHQALEMSSK